MKDEKGMFTSEQEQKGISSGFKTRKTSLQCVNKNCRDKNVWLVYEDYGGKDFLCKSCGSEFSHIKGMPF
ncbi:MAG: hypothetical protein ACOCQD_01190 [archaeon]